MFLPRYQVEEYQGLTDRMEFLANELNTYYYGSGVDTDRQQRLKTIQELALPDAEKLRRLVPQFKALKLPGKLKKEAETESTLVGLQCQYYQLLYLEFKEQTDKYRPKIDSITFAINEVRAEWFSKN